PCGLFGTVKYSVHRCVFVTIEAQYPNKFLFYIERAIKKSFNRGLTLRWSWSHAKGGNAADTSSATD
ncbi:hypothetical protein, partial [Pantoea sp. Pa-EAmG]|uniref:hypothetical protein n=1 Tax=Pantoea sp. Pa-EAmG TaxID=3043311 RepID=UPI0024AF70C1